MIREIEGVVDSQIFYNDKNHFGVFRVISSASNDRPVTIVGHFFQIEVDSFYTFTGQFIEDPRFGLQFKVEAYTKRLPRRDEFIVRYLSGSNFPGIGKRTAKAVVKQLGSEALEIIRDTDVLNLEGVKPKSLKIIKDILKEQSDFESSVEFLNSHGITGNIIQSIMGKYGEKAKEKLIVNPYRMIEEVSGVGFKTADRLGQSLGFADDHPARIAGLMIDCFQTVCYGPGHSYINSDMLRTSLQLDPEQFDQAYQTLLQRGVFIEEDDKLYHHTQYTAETTIAHFLTQHQSEALEVQDLEGTMAKVQARLNIDFDKTQCDAIRQIFAEPVVVITGGPGTGKSTLMSGLISIIQREFPELHITLCAPTGRAAKRLTSLTRVRAATLHSILKWNLHNNEFGVNAENPLETDIVIVDEFSMVDTWLFYKLLEGSANVKKFVFVGDKDQLPSVGPGYVLSDLIQSEAFPVVRLETNYRQVQGSEVIDLALDLNKGQFNIEQYNRDVKFFDTRYGEAKDVVVKIVREALDRGYSLNDVQVLSPKYYGSSGIDALNHFLQKTCNPARPDLREIQVGSRVFREGDKILQLKNQPDDGVYNGDIGFIVEIDFRTVIVDFDGIEVAYDNTNYINITHAYAMSVHKAQGSEYPIVILLGSNQFGQMLSRKLYYTAITRSSKSVVLVGEEAAFKRAAEHDDLVERKTHLKARILEAKKKHQA